MKLPSLKGRTLHETLFDPRQFRLQVKKSFNESSKQSFAGQAPGVFVGRYGYPNVRIGLLATEEDKSHDNPLSWVRHQTPLKDIVSLRSGLVNANQKAHVKIASLQTRKLKDLSQEAAMAVRPVDMDVDLDRKPQFRLNLNDESMPHGPDARLQKAALTSNPKVPRAVDKVVSDTDLKASAGLGSLWKRGYGEHHLSKLLSSATLGQKLERRFVPTRWGITAVDDTVGKQLRGQLQDYQEADFQACFGGYMGNYYLVLLYPQPWSFELFENYAGGKGPVELSTWYTDYEGVRGRKHYADRTAGGYYASRLAALESLAHRKRKAGVLSLRFITDEYWAPLGVWVVREASRAAFSGKPLTFSSAELMERYAIELVRKRFGADLRPVLEASKLRSERKSQTTLAHFS